MDNIFIKTLKILGFGFRSMFGSLVKAYKRWKTEVSSPDVEFGELTALFMVAILYITLIGFGAIVILCGTLLVLTAFSFHPYVSSLIAMIILGPLFLMLKLRYEKHEEMERNRLKTIEESNPFPPVENKKKTRTTKTNVKTNNTRR